MFKFVFTLLLILFPSALLAQDNARECSVEFGKWVCRDKNENPFDKLNPPANAGDAFNEAFQRAREEKKDRKPESTVDFPVDTDIVGTGNLFLENCKQAVNQSYCSGYLKGIVDGLRNGEGISQIDRGEEPESNLFCPPAKVTYGQIRDIITKYMEDNPELRHNATPHLIVISLRNTFPCR